MSGGIEVRAPRTTAEFDAYYCLRHAVLRAPWGQAEGSERDDLEAQSVHLLAIDDAGRVLAVGRLHRLGAIQAQIRYMAVRPEYARQGLGRRVLTELEIRAQSLGCTEILLNARAAAAGFYRRHGYVELGPGPLLFGSIEHLRMHKIL